MTTSPTSKKVKKSVPEMEGREFDHETQKYLEEIDGYQNELDHINELASEEIITVEQKYNKIRKPFFDKRTESITKIPHFWQIAFTNHPDLYPLLGQCEDDCFNHLTKIEVIEFPDIKSGFRIEFYFEENPYFENSTLMKEYRLGGRPYPECVVTPIIWKKGMDITSIPSTSKSSSSKQPAEYKSFFVWYNSVIDPITDVIAETIKDDLWYNPLQYFLLPDINAGNTTEDNDDGEDEDLLPFPKREIVVKEEPPE